MHSCIQFATQCAPVCAKCYLKRIESTSLSSVFVFIGARERSLDRSFARSQHKRTHTKRRTKICTRSDSERANSDVNYLLGSSATRMWYKRPVRAILLSSTTCKCAHEHHNFVCANGNDVCASTLKRLICLQDLSPSRFALIHPLTHSLTATHSTAQYRYW